MSCVNDSFGHTKNTFFLYLCLLEKPMGDVGSDYKSSYIWLYYNELPMTRFIQWKWKSSMFLVCLFRLEKTKKLLCWAQGAKITSTCSLAKIMNVCHYNTERLKSSYIFSQPMSIQSGCKFDTLAPAESSCLVS